MRCCVLLCKSDTGDSLPGLSFHSFPSNPEIRQKWIFTTGRKDWVPNKYSRICSKHFAADQLWKKGKKAYIHPHAIPVKFINTESVTNVEASKSAEACINTSQCATLESSPENMPGLLKRKLTDMPEPSKTKDISPECMPGPAKRRLIDMPEPTKEKLNETSPQITPRTLKRKWIKERQRSEERLAKLKALREKSRRLTKKVANLENILTALKAKSFITDEDCELLGSVDSINRDFLKRTLNPGPNNTKYSPSLRKFALSLHFISPRAYNFVRSTFNSCLPHPSTLRSWYRSMDGNPGFTKESLECVKLLVQRAQGKKIYCALSLDEMAIRKHVQWDGEKCVGLVNFGEVLDGHNVAVAREALVFMVTAVNDSWKIPVGYFLVDGCTGAQKANLVNQCVELLISCGVYVLSLTFDGCPANISMAKNLGCQLEPSELDKIRTSFIVKNQEISIFLDPAHMIKLVRNTLGEKKELTNSNNKKILWEYIVNLNNLQNNEGLHLANKLRSQHINFAKQIMKVKLAAQTFSNSVAESIELCDKDLGLAEFAGSEATVEFIKNINTLFDIFNSRNFNTFGFKKPVSENNYSVIESFLNYMETYIVGLKLNGKSILQSNRKVGFFGFYVCIKSLKIIYQNVVCSKILKFIPLYKISQDHLEFFFSSIRAKGGFNNNPTALQFKSAYKRLVIHGEIKHVTSGNCIPLEDINILTFSQIRYEKKINMFTNVLAESIDKDESVPQVDLPTIDSDHDYLADPSRLSLYTREVIRYIAGFVVKKLRNTIKCEECLLALITEKYHGLIAKKDKGGLIYPSNSTIKICEIAEKIFRMRSHQGINFYSDKNLMQKLLLSCFKDCMRDRNIFLNLHNNNIQSLIGNHKIMLLKAVAMHYFEVRIHHSTKQFFAPIERIRNIHNKLVLFQGQ